MRIYFPEREDIEFPEDIDVRAGSAQGTFRINNNAYWWQLVRVGFRLGTHHRVDDIRESIPDQFRADFDRGI